MKTINPKVCETTVGISLRTKGRYNVKVYRADGTLKTETGWFENKLLDAGLRVLAAANVGENYYISYAFAFGRGNTPVEFSNTGLANFAFGYRGQMNLAATKVYHTTGGAPRTVVTAGVRGTAITAEQAGNISELGVTLHTGDQWGSQWPAADSTYISRALLRNALGEPVTLTLEEGEQIEAYWELTVYAPEETTVSVPHNIDGVETLIDVQYRPANLSDGASVSKCLYSFTAYRIPALAMLLSNSTAPFVTNASGDGTLGPVTGSAGASAPGSLMTGATAVSAYNIANPRSRDIVLEVPAGVARRILGGNALTEWCPVQFKLATPIEKPASHRYRLNVRVSLDNYGGN